MSDDIREKIGVLTAKVDAAHIRVDRVETEIKSTLKDLHEDMKELNAHMNKSKGGLAVMVFLSGGTGAGLAILISKLMN